MPELQLNSGPQDALLYDNTRSYFTNVGYVRTSNFQLELRDVDPQNEATLGSTVQFVIPKAADLLGPVDLVLDLAEAKSDSGSATQFTAWVEAVGFAMIEEIVFSVGTHTIETITGDQLNIINELMTNDSQRLGRETILKTGHPSVYTQLNTTSVFQYRRDQSEPNRVITFGESSLPAKSLIVPLGLFFTKHPSQYFPLAAISGNDVRVSVKLRALRELVVMSAVDYTISNREIVSTTKAGVVNLPTFDGDPVVTGSCKLRCHYVHVTGPEKAVVMNKEHVRLLKLWQVNTNVVSPPPSASKTRIASIDLSFLHPVAELIITVRKVSEMGSSTSTDIKPADSDQGAITKNYFAYHGGGSDPNVDSLRRRYRGIGTVPGAVDSGTADDYMTIDNFKVTLNGKERHPSLGSNSLDRNYLMNRLMPMLHSNATSVFSNVHGVGAVDAVSAAEFDVLSEAFDRKQIYVYPFSLNPEGSNPSGAVNFSKVSHAKLDIEGTVTGSAGVEYQVDVYGVHYNWLQIRDGRALMSFS